MKKDILTLLFVLAKRTTLTVLSMVILVNGLYAQDIDIYRDNSEAVKPNVLIVLDHSGSMKNEDAGGVYDDRRVYEPWVGMPDLGNYDNWYNYNRTRWQIAKNVITHLLDETEGVRFGLIRMDGSKYNTGLADSDDRTNPPRGVTYTDGVSDGRVLRQGGKILCPVGMDKTQIISFINSMPNNDPQTWTVLAETLFSAGRYFAGGNDGLGMGGYKSDTEYTYRICTDDDGDCDDGDEDWTSYPARTTDDDGNTIEGASPIQYWCQRNFVILMTDGQANYDDDWTTLTALVGDYDGDGEEATTSNRYLDDVAEFLYDNDLRADMEGKQNIVTHTIAFAITDGDTKALVENAAIQGGGTYHTVDNYDQLHYALERIIGEILEVSSSYTAPVVPISHMEKTTSASSLYVALFKPSKNAFWKGNIKKYGLDDNGDVVDSLGNPATDSMGVILDGSQSYWTSAPDGGETDSGGVGQLLLDRVAAREIYTYTRIEKSLKHPNNAFTTSNDKLTKELFQVVTDAEKDQIIDFIYGYDVYDEDRDGDTAEKRKWILGSILHSRPTVINYGDTLRVIYVGANDGMLHAFLDSDGSELWGFVPTDLYANLQKLHSSQLHYFVDGSPRAVVIDSDGNGEIKKKEGDSAFLIFGERRGGDTYYALDVTDPYDPAIMWMIEGGDPGFEQLGQSWSTPQLEVLENGQLAAIFGAGYDPDRDLGVDTDDIGRGVFVVNALTGELIWKWTIDEDFTMTACIPSDVAVIDSNDNGKIDRMYVGDLDGYVRRFEMGDPDPLSWSAWTIFSTGGRKIFYPPDILQESGYELLVWGTGDRTQPNRRDVENRIYMFKDMNDMIVYDESALVDLTVNILDDPDADPGDKQQVLTDLSNSKGWYIRLENEGEKILSGIVTLLGTSYATTFSPTNVEGDPCSMSEGTARLYAVNYRLGTAVQNLDQSVNASLDRSIVIGTSIPSGVQIAILRGKIKGFVGVSGGVYEANVGTKPTLITNYWRYL